MRGCEEITRWLGCSYLEKQQQRWSCATRIFPSLLVLPIEEWQQVNVHCQLSVVTGDEARLGGSDVCLCLQGEQKHWLLCSLSYKSFKPVLQRFTDYPKLCKCNSYSRRRSPRVFKQIKPTCERIWELKRGTFIWRGLPSLLAEDYSSQINTISFSRSPATVVGQLETWENCNSKMEPLSKKQPSLKNNCPPGHHSKCYNIISTMKKPYWSVLTLSA